MALTTFGSTDANTWGWFWLAVRDSGFEVYHRYAVFNHPPFILQFLPWVGGSPN